jgi:putative addiction module component (TIGR02574 family)
MKNIDTVMIKHELHDYIDNATDERLEEVYVMLKGNNAENYKWWEDKELVAELERRSADLKSGKDKGVPWEEVKQRLLNKYVKDGQ